jgi:peptidoglycan/LPS O-acetylase OafA/YrhL
MSLTDSPLGPDGLRHSLTYQPALDGVRAMAVALVVAFHFGVRGFHGGFVGVDVFFGLSGYLITTLLLKEFNDTGRIAPVSFWIRRFKRLLPALTVMVLVSTIAASIFFPVGYYPSLVADGLAALFYVSNWHQIGTHATYFTSLNAPSIVTHTWSLSIEEQFYWLWPLIVLGLLRLRRHPFMVTGVAGLGAVASAIAMRVGYSGSGSATRLYFGTDTHVEGLLLGAAAAGLTYVIRRQRVVASGALDPAITGLGALGLAGVAAITYRAYGDSTFMFRGGFLILGFMVALLVSSLALVPHSVLARAFSLRPIAYVGRISYGLYLWHYPVSTVLDHFNTGLSGLSLLVARSVLTVGLTLASYYALELPIRRHHWARPRRAAVLAVASVTAVTLTCVVTARGVQSLPAYTVIAPTALHDSVSAYIIGDSEILTFGIVTNRQRIDADVAVTSDAQLGCGIIGASSPVLKGSRFFQNPLCRIRRDGTWPLQQRWRHAILVGRPNVVIVGAGRWETHDQKIGRLSLNITDRAFRQRIVASLEQIYLETARAHSTLVLVTTSCAHSGETPSGNYYPEDSPRRIAAYNNLLRAFAATHPVSVYDLNARVCPQGQFTYYDHGVQIRDADGVHYTAYAGPIFGPEFWSTIRHLGLENRAARRAL